MTSGCGSTSASSIDPDAAGTPDSGACPNSLAPGDYTETLDHDGVLREYLTGCSAGVEVTLCTINAGHVLYADAVTQGAAIPDVAWEAFARQTLP
jgi:hypothetical protein